MLEPVNVLICDDSAVIRRAVSQILSECKLVRTVGTAINGKFGLYKLQELKPDVVLLDIEMPEMNGLEFLREVRRLQIDTPVIVFPSLAKRGARTTIEALSLGAVDYVMKPSGITLDTLTESVRLLLNQVLIYGYRYKSLKSGNHEYLKLAKPIYEAEPVSPLKKKESASTSVPRDLAIKPKELSELLIGKKNIPEPLPPDERPARIVPPRLIVIGISTGGPNALRSIIPFIPGSLPIPIVIVQHMPEGFTKEFAKSLNDISELNVKEADDGDFIEAGTVFIAPGDAHVKIQNGMRIRLDRGEPVNGHRPSADVLFESAARVTGAGTVGIIMTGMGRDGALKLGDIYNSGGFTIAQSKESCIIFGMPGTAVEYGYVDSGYSCKKILEYLQNLCK